MLLESCESTAGNVRICKRPLSQAHAMSVLRTVATEHVSPRSSFAATTVMVSGQLQWKSQILCAMTVSQCQILPLQPCATDPACVGQLTKGKSLFLRSTPS